MTLKEKLEKALEEGHVIDIKDEQMTCKVSRIALDGTCLVVTADSQDSSHRRVPLDKIVTLLVRFWSKPSLEKALEGLS